jgi:AcrR family transcriptional regulator
MTIQFFTKKMADRKQERKKILDAVTKHDILEAAINIISRDGVTGLTMDKIAAEARVAKGTLYVHFQNKQEVVDAAIESSIAPLLEELVDILDSHLTPSDKLRKFTLSNLNFFNTHKELFRVTIYDQDHVADDTKRYRSDRYWDIVGRVASVLEDGMTQGLFMTADPIKMAMIFIEANRAVFVKRLSMKDSEDIESDSNLIFDVFMHGISTNVSANRNHNE